VHCSRRDPCSLLLYTLYTFVHTYISISIDIYISIYISIDIYIDIYILVVLGIEPRALHRLAEFSTTELHLCIFLLSHNILLKERVTVFKMKDNSTNEQL
jgi:hypothetical protein